MDMMQLMVTALKNGASDLHITTGNSPYLRINGDMKPMQLQPFTSDQVKHLIYGLMTDHQRSEYERDLELDFAITMGNDARFRVNAFNTISGPAAVLRSIPVKVKSLEELKAPDMFKRLAGLHKGLVLVTGPTGSGKSTTLAAILNHANETREAHILTVEDPIEFLHTSKKSLINQREVGKSTLGFANALKSALREDPDIILVGEMRDLETIQLALTAAETGHLVMGTLHTSSAPKTVDRIIDVFPENSKGVIRAMLAASIEAVITQSLIKKREGGRVAAHEILVATPAIRNLIREDKIHQLPSMMQIGSKYGMQTMKDAVHGLLKDNIISDEEAKKVLVSGSEEESQTNANNQQAATTGPQQAPMGPRGPRTGLSGGF
jgi:twitching motility protein PilT